MAANIAIGVPLLVVGGILIFVGRRSSKRRDVSASGGSIAVGGNNTGSINNQNIHAPTAAHSSGTHWLTTIGIIVELVGIGVTLWHAFHLAAT